MGTRDFWQFVNTFAPWLSALGTIAAVVTALMLARRERNIHFRVRAGVRTILGAGIPQQDYLAVLITNVGLRLANVTHIGWRTGFLRKHEYVWIVPQNAVSSPIPAKLADGESANYFMPMRDFNMSVADLAKGFQGRFPRLWVHSICVVVSTATGHTFRRRVEKDLRAKFLDVIRTTPSGSEGPSSQQGPSREK